MYIFKGLKRTHRRTTCPCPIVELQTYARHTTTCQSCPWQESRVSLDPYIRFRAETSLQTVYYPGGNPSISNVSSLEEDGKVTYSDDVFVRSFFRYVLPFFSDNDDEFDFVVAFAAAGRDASSEPEPASWADAGAYSCTSAGTTILSPNPARQV